MTEAEWMGTPDPTKLIEYLRASKSDRKLKLYFCAGLRQLSHLLYYPPSIENIGVIEQFVDGQATDYEMGSASWSAEAAGFGYDFNADFHDRYPIDKAVTVFTLVELGALAPSALTGGEWKVNEEIRHRLVGVARLIELLTYTYSSAFRAKIVEWTTNYMANVNWPGYWLRNCIFGNPFRPVRVHPSWLTPSIVSLASGIYEDRAFDRLPILADALQEADCTNEGILNHCRQPGERVRGCWVIDLLTGRAGANYTTRVRQ